MYDPAQNTQSSAHKTAIFLFLAFKKTRKYTRALQQEKKNNKNQMKMNKREVLITIKNVFLPNH
jgi:hypothetical protein